MRTTSSLSLLVLVLLGSACDDAAKKRGIGATCGDPEECASGVCYQSTCLDPVACGAGFELGASDDPAQLACIGAMTAFVLEPADSVPSEMGDLQYRTFATYSTKRFETTKATTFSSSEPNAVFFDAAAPGIAIFNSNLPGTYTITATLGTRSATVRVTIPDSGSGTADAIGPDAAIPDTTGDTGGATGGDAFADAGPDTSPTDTSEVPEQLFAMFASPAEFPTDLHAERIAASTRIVGSGDHGTLELHIAATTAGTFTCADGVTWVYWTQTAQDQRDTHASGGGSCTITIDRYGAVGERIEGRFNAMINGVDSTDAFMAIPVDAGKFSVTRGPDQP
ncbi:MAG: hypothetical protein JNJ59_23610 [Deltaproteobacteria bacterium]|nr:hypothetical protein [Deltaproteobacteria bacterium]